MSCRQTEHLDSLVRGELPAARATAVRAHAEQCAQCRHELKWLSTEKTLFAQRATRTEVQRLWAQMEGRSTPQKRGWGQVAFAIAASVLVLTGLSLHSAVPQPSQVSAADFDAPMSLESMSLSRPESGCSVLPEGQGFRCEAPYPATFISQR